MAKAKTLRCNRCDRSFSMPAHLARHMSAVHGLKAKGGRRRAGRARRRRGAATRLGGARRGRPPLVATKLGLHKMTNDQLVQVMETTRSLLQDRLRVLQDVVG